MQALSTAGTFGLALLFGAAVLGKIDGWSEWKALAERITPSWSRLLAGGVPVVELAVGATLLVSPAYGAPAAALVLFALAVVSYALWRRIGATPCNCFGPLLPGVFGPRLVTRNALLAILAAATAGLTVVHPPRTEAAIYALAAACALVVFVGVESMHFRRIATHKEIET